MKIKPPMKEESGTKISSQHVDQIRTIHVEWNSLGYKCKNILKKQNIRTCFKKSASLANLLRNPITKGNSTDGSYRGVVYQIPCKTDCPKKYIGETGRDFKIRFDEHKKGVLKGNIISKLVEHVMDSKHKPEWDKKKVLWKNIHSKGKRLFLEA